MQKRRKDARHMPQVRLGAAEWRTVDAAEFSPMEVFGYRQRVDRVGIVTSKNRAMTDSVRLRLAEWVAREYAKRHPEAGLITGVQLTQTSHTTNQQTMELPSGHWQCHSCQAFCSLHARHFVLLDDAGQVRGHSTGNAHGELPHLQIYDFYGTIYRIFFGE